MRASRGVARTVPLAATPDVIVPADRLAAVRRLVREVNAGRIEPPLEPLQEPGAAVPVPLAVVPIVVEPILVLPLDPDRK
jgi:hypothetical protein